MYKGVSYNKGLDMAEHGAAAYELQDVFKVVASKGDNFASRLTHLGKPVAASDK